MSFLKLESLAKTYPDGTEAVRGVDLCCQRGELIVLLGPSGCGKTTTLRMVAGLEKPSAGRILLEGVDMASWPPQRRDVGFVFQFYALYPHLTVRENVSFPLGNRALSADAQAQLVEAMAERLGIEALLDRYPRQLSGGDQQRVSLARAMIRKPRLYLMDEPLGTLDADLRLAMRELIRDQQLRDGVTTLYVTHDQEEAMSLADRVVVMEGGTIRQSARAAEVYADPADLFVAHFIGSPGMNFAEGQVRDGAFRAEGFVWPLEGEWPSGALTLGVRPESVHLASEGALRGEVLVEEYMGSCRYVHVDTPCGRWVLRSEEETGSQPGEQVGIELEADGVRLFDGQSGRRLQ